MPNCAFADPLFFSTVETNNKERYTMGKVFRRMFESVTLVYTKIMHVLPPKSIPQRNTFEHSIV